jgi:hypothetical protein
LGINKVPVSEVEEPYLVSRSKSHIPYTELVVMIHWGDVATWASVGVAAVGVVYAARSGIKKPGAQAKKVSLVWKHDADIVVRNDSFAFITNVVIDLVAMPQPQDMPCPLEWAGLTQNDLDITVRSGRIVMDHVPPQSPDSRSPSRQITVSSDLHASEEDVIIRWHVKPPPHVPVTLDVDRLRQKGGGAVSFAFHLSTVPSTRQLYEALVSDLNSGRYWPSIVHLLIPVLVSDVTASFTDSRGNRWRRYSDGRLTRPKNQRHPTSATRSRQAQEISVTWKRGEDQFTVHNNSSGWIRDARAEFITAANAADSIPRPYGWESDDIEAEISVNSITINDVPPDSVNHAGIWQKISPGTVIRVNWSAKSEPHTPSGLTFDKFWTLIGEKQISAASENSSPRALYEELVWRANPWPKPFSRDVEQALLMAIEDVTLTFADAGGAMWRLHAVGGLEYLGRTESRASH